MDNGLIVPYYLVGAKQGRSTAIQPLIGLRCQAVRAVMAEPPGHKWMDRAAKKSCVVMNTGYPYRKPTLVDG